MIKILFYITKVIDEELDSVQKYTYDANGSMLTRDVDGTTYTMGYDTENRLTSIAGETLTARYVFDGDGAKHAKQRECSL